MIGVMAFIGSALLFGGLILAGIAGWVIEVICARQVYRETCAHCQWQGMPEECADCPTKIAYDYIDERNARIYYTEVRHLHENFRSSYLRRMCMDIKGGRARGKV